MKRVISFTRKFKLLSDRNRLYILKAISNKKLCVSDIAKKTKISPTLASRNLKLLEREGLIKGIREGKNVYYELNKYELDKLVVEFYDFLNIPREAEKIPDFVKEIIKE